MASGKGSESVAVAPLRTLDDFILKEANFQVPNFQDLDKWGNRVYNNLIYYQSNYFLMALSLFSLVTFFHPFKMFLGVVAIGIGITMFALANNAGPQVSKFKVDHPVVSLVLLLIGCYFIIYLLGGIVVLVFGVLLPISAVFIHASLRLRNLRNKLSNKMEKIGLKKLTPMGVILDSLGIEAELLE